jgi:hypothetical protein
LQQRKTELQSIVDKYKPLFIQLGSIDVMSVTTRKQLQDTSVVQHLILARKEETAKLEKQ